MGVGGRWLKPLGEGPSPSILLTLTRQLLLHNAAPVSRVHAAFVGRC